MNQNAKEVGQRIKKIRTDLGYSMAQFGELISHSPKTTVNNWERGVNLPKEDKLNKIAILGKTEVNYLLYGTPEEFMDKLVEEHFHLKINSVMLDQMVSFLKQQNVDLYDEITIIDFIQGIIDSGAISEQEEPYLVYSKVAGTNELYLVNAANDPVDTAPQYYAYIEEENATIHFLPYTFAKRQRALYKHQPNLQDQVTIDYYTRTFELLNIPLKEATIIYYGIDTNHLKVDIGCYRYNQKSKVFDQLENKANHYYKTFLAEVKKEIAYLSITR